MNNTIDKTNKTLEGNYFKDPLQEIEDSIEIMVKGGKITW